MEPNTSSACIPLYHLPSDHTLSSLLISLPWAQTSQEGAQTTDQANGTMEDIYSAAKADIDEVDASSAASARTVAPWALPCM